MKRSLIEDVVKNIQLSDNQLHYLVEMLGESNCMVDLEGNIRRITIRPNYSIHIDFLEHIVKQLKLAENE